MSKKRSPLSSSEWSIMKVVWELQRTNVREVCEEVQKQESWAYSTVKTMMERLEDKGYLESKKAGNSRLYAPKVEEEEVRAKATRGFLKQVFDGSLGSLVNCLVEENDLTEDESKEIMKLLRKKKGGEK